MKRKKKKGVYILYKTTEGKKNNTHNIHARAKQLHSRWVDYPLTALLGSSRSVKLIKQTQSNEIEDKTCKFATQAVTAGPSWRCHHTRQHNEHRLLQHYATLLFFLFKKFVTPVLSSG